MKAERILNDAGERAVEITTGGDYKVVVHCYGRRYSAVHALADNSQNFLVQCDMPSAAVAIAREFLLIEHDARRI